MRDSGGTIFSVEKGILTLVLQKTGSRDITNTTYPFVFDTLCPDACAAWDFMVYFFDPQVESGGRIDRPPPLPPHHPRQHIGPFTVQL
jgi:hypothetical protein